MIVFRYAVQAWVYACIMCGVSACAGTTPKPNINFKSGAVDMPTVDNKKYYDRHPEKITENDLKLLETINKRAYDATEVKKDGVRADLIYSFIVSHRRHISEYDRLKVTTTLDVGSRTRNPYSQSYNYNPIESKQFYSAYVELTYPIYDKRTDMRIKNETLRYNLSIADKVKEYAEAYDDMLQYADTLNFLRLKQRVVKGEALSGVKSRDEWLQILDQIRLAKIGLRKARSSVRALRVYLLTLTTDPKGLMKLL